MWVGGYRFDSGPSLLLFPDEYRRTFEWLGCSLEQHVQLARVQPAAYRVFFADGYSTSGSAPSVSSLDLLYDVQAMVQQLEQLQPGAGVYWGSVKRACGSAVCSVAQCGAYLSACPAMGLTDLAPGASPASCTGDGTALERVTSKGQKQNLLPNFPCVCDICTIQCVM